MERPKEMLLSSAMLLGLLVVFASLSKADTVYSDLGPGDSYASSGNAILGATAVTGLPGTYNYAVEFTPTADYDLTEIDLAIQYVTGTNGVDLYLDSNSGGEPDTESPILSWDDVTGPLSYGGLLSVSPGSSTELLSGTTYWIVAEPVASNTEEAWWGNNTGATGVASNIGSGWVYSSTAPSPAFDVLGDPVPEPGTLFLLGTGLIALAAAAKRKFFT